MYFEVRFVRRFRADVLAYMLSCRYSKNHCFADYEF